jgi:hypothetical protein
LIHGRSSDSNLSPAHRPTRNMARYYSMSIEVDMFGSIILRRQRGRIGKPGQGRRSSTPLENMRSLDCKPLSTSSLSAATQFAKIVRALITQQRLLCLRILATRRLPCGSRSAGRTRGPQHQIRSCQASRPQNPRQVFRGNITGRPRQDITDDDLHHGARHRFDTREPDLAPSRFRKWRDRARGKRLATPAVELRRVNSGRTSIRRHIGSGQKRLGDKLPLLII